MEGDATRITVYLTEDDHLGRQSAWRRLVEQARDDGLAGATVWRGVEGFGRRGYLRSSRFVDAAQAMPIAVEIVDAAERIDAYLPVVERVAPDALVVRQQVELRRRLQRPLASGGLDDPRPGSAGGQAPRPAGG